MIDRPAASDSGSETQDRVSLADELFKRAVAVIRERNYDEAVALLRGATALNDAYPEAHNNLGAILTALGRHAEAEAACRRAIELREAYPGAHNNLGLILAELKRYREAEAAFRRAIALDGTYAEAYNNLGLTLAGQERLAEAEIAYRHAIARKYAYSNAHHNLGLLLAAQKRNADAEAAYHRAIAINPDNYRAYLNLSQLQLGLGDYAEGWRNFEVRARATQKPPPLSLPRWQGGDISGKSLLLVCEQGYGDCIQFVRYASLLKQSGARRVVVYAPDDFYRPLHRLMITTDGVDACICVKPEQGEFDYWDYMMSLPFRFKTAIPTIPDRLPYIAVAPAAEERRGRKPVVGLVWAGNPRPEKNSAAAMDHRRSMQLDQMLPLLRIPDVEFVSLQKDEPARSQIAELPQELRPIDAMEGVNDFADTAAIVQRLDLVISVDTSVVHLAGALGKPIWLLNRFDGCWRWLQDRGDSPWYPGVMRIFRQPGAKDWSSVIEQVRRALQAWLEGER